jgi:hypothetical protein
MATECIDGHLYYITAPLVPRIKVVAIFMGIDPWTGKYTFLLNGNIRSFQQKYWKFEEV